MKFPKTPTQKYLKSIGACSEAREWVSKQHLSEAWKTCERLDWMQWLVTAAAGAEYDRVTAAAGAEFQRVTAAAWAEYDKAVAAAGAEFQRVTAPAWAEYDKAVAAARAEYDKVTAAAWAEFQRVKAPSLACKTCDEIRRTFTLTVSF